MTLDGVWGFSGIAGSDGKSQVGRGFGGQKNVNVTGVLVQRELESGLIVDIPKRKVADASDE